MNKDLIIIFVGRAVQVGLGFATVKLFTAYLSPDEVGNLYLINSLVGLLSLALISPVGNYINRNMHTWAERKVIINHFSIFNLYLLFITVCSSGIIYALHAQMGVGKSLGLIALLLLVCGTVYLFTWNQVITIALNLLNHRISFVVFSVLTLGGGLGFSLLFVERGDPSAINWLTGQLIGYLVATVAAYWYFVKTVENKFDMLFVRSAMSLNSLYPVIAFTFPLAITSFFMWLQYQSYRIIIERTINLEYLGMVGLGLGIAANISGIAESLVQQFYQPIFYKEINTHDHGLRTQAWNRMAHLALPFYLSFTLFISLLSPYLITLLTNTAYRDAARFIVYGAWIELFRMTTSVLSSVSYAEMQTKYLMKSYMAGGLFTLVAVYLCALHPSSRQWIPAALVAGGLITVITMYLDMSKLMKLTIGRARLRHSFLVSLPLVAVVLFYDKADAVLVSVICVLIASLYFAIIQIMLYRSLSSDTARVSSVVNGVG